MSAPSVGTSESDCDAARNGAGPAPGAFVSLTQVALKFGKIVHEWATIVHRRLQHVPSTLGDLALGKLKWSGTASAKQEAFTRGSHQPPGRPMSTAALPSRMVMG